MWDLIAEHYDAMRVIAENTAAVFPDTDPDDLLQDTCLKLLQREFDGRSFFGLIKTTMRNLCRDEYRRRCARHEREQRCSKQEAYTPTEYKSFQDLLLALAETGTLTKVERATLAWWEKHETYPPKGSALWNCWYRKLRPKLQKLWEKQNGCRPSFVGATK